MRSASREGGGMTPDLEHALAYNRLRVRVPLLSVAALLAWGGYKDITLPRLSRGFYGWRSTCSKTGGTNERGGDDVPRSLIFF